MITVLVLCPQTVVSLIFKSKNFSFIRPFCCTILWYNRRQLLSVDPHHQGFLFCDFLFTLPTHPIIAISVSSLERTDMRTPILSRCNPHNAPLLSISLSIRSQRLLSSSVLHPGRRAPSACGPASREGPGIWPRSGPDIQIPLWSALPPCNGGVHTSCGRR